MYIDINMDNSHSTKIDYHSIFKEILTVKRGIEKFEFHLTRYHFVMEINMIVFLPCVSQRQKDFQTFI